MPNQKRRSNGPAKKSSSKRRTTRRRTPNNSLRSQTIITLRTKTTPKKQEIYPISLTQLISRANIGSDVDITCSGYSLAVTIATGNDPATVTANLGHSGPWVRRGDNQIDTFNQQSVEHNFSRSKTVIFKVNLRASERQYFNPDIATNYVNLRINDPCGVIPGATLKIETRAILQRKVMSTTFLEKDEPVTDRYEDQDVSTGASSGQPQPPTNIQDVPATVFESSTRRSFSPTGTTSPLVYTSNNDNSTFTVTAAGKLNIVGEVVLLSSDSPSELQQKYTADGFEGTITYKFQS